MLGYHSVSRFVFANEFVKFFTDDRHPARLARYMALRIANKVSPVKRIIRNKLTEQSNRGGLLPSLFRSG